MTPKKNFEHLKNACFQSIQKLRVEGKWQIFTQFCTLAQRELEPPVLLVSRLEGAAHIPLLLLQKVLALPLVAIFSPSNPPTGCNLLLLHSRLLVGILSKGYPA